MEISHPRNTNLKTKLKYSVKVLYSETLFRNSVYLMLSTGTMSAFGFIFWLIVAHLYRPDQIGIASTLISSMNFIKYFSLLGFDSTFIRFLAKTKRKNEHIDTGLVIVAACALIAGSLYVLFAPHFAPRLILLHQHLLLGIGFAIFCIGATLNLVTDSVFVAYRSAGYNLLIDGVVGSGTQLLLPIILVGIGAYGIFAAQGLAACLAMAVSILALTKWFGYKPRFKINRNVLSEVKHYSFQNYLASLLDTIPFIVIPIIILNKLGASLAGYYYLAFMMANLLFTVVYAVAQSLFAEGSFGERGLRPLIKRAAIFLGALIIPASILFVFVGPYILEAFGKIYGENSRQVLIVLAASAPFLAASAIGSIIMRITKQTGALISVNALYALVVCGLTALWASRGLVWVAGAWFVGQFITAIVTYLALAMRRRPATGSTPV